MSRLPLIFGALGAAFLAVAIPLGLRERAFEKRAAEVEAVVVSTDQPVWSRQARATVEFDGRRATVWASGSFEKFEVGQRVRIRVDDAGTAAIVGSMRGWVLPVVFGVLGSLFVLASIVVAVVLLRVSRRVA